MTPTERAVATLIGAEARFTAAFRAELAEHPNVPPGPTALNKRLGRMGGKMNNIHESQLRSRLLISAGFVKNNNTRKWEKKK